mgnify:CR=1 FL=1
MHKIKRTRHPLFFWFYFLVHFSTLEKIFNITAGIDKFQDTLPERLLNDPIVAGPTKGEIYELDILLPEYYSVRGWDENGVPTEDTLKKLGLDEYIGNIEAGATC